MSGGKNYAFLLKQMQDHGSKVEGTDSVEDQVSRVESLESRVQSRGSTVEDQESRIETLQSKVQVQGPEVKQTESRVENLESRVQSLESRSDTLNLDALEEAIEEAKKKPRLGLYSPLASAVLKYKAITTPRYSMGSEIKTIVEQALKTAYPEVYQEVIKRMGA